MALKHNLEHTLQRLAEGWRHLTQRADSDQLVPFLRAKTESSSEQIEYRFNHRPIARRHGMKIGAMNPTVFQDQCYKLGSLGNPDPKVQ